MVGTIKTAIIWNKNSGMSAHHKLKQSLKKNAENYNLALYETFSSEQGIQSLLTCLGEEVKIIVLVGGDGTTRLLCEYLLKHTAEEDRPALALVSGGTTNLIHRDIGYDFKNIDSLFSTIYKNCYRIERISCLEIRKTPPAFETESRYYGFFLGLGALPDLTRSINKAPYQAGMRGKIMENIFGNFIFLRLALGVPKSHKILYPRDLELSTDNKTWRNKTYVLGFLTSLKQIIFGITPPFPDKKSFICLLKYPYKNFLQELNRLRKSLIPKGDALDVDGISHPLYLRFTGGWVLDGMYMDLKEGEMLKISESKKLAFLVPDKQEEEKL